MMATLCWSLHTLSKLITEFLVYLYILYNRRSIIMIVSRNDVDEKRSWMWKNNEFGLVRSRTGGCVTMPNRTCWQSNNTVLPLYFPLSTLWCSSTTNTFWILVVPCFNGCQSKTSAGQKYLVKMNKTLSLVNCWLALISASCPLVLCIYLPSSDAAIRAEMMRL